MDIEDYTADEEVDERRSRRMEMVLGLAVVAVVIGFVLFSYFKQETQAGHYHAGLDALNNRDPETALLELTAAGGYLDSDALIDTAHARTEQRDALYRQATELASTGKWWQAARTIIDMQEIQARYKDSDSLLAQARTINGPVYYTHRPPDDLFGAGGQKATYTGGDKDGIYVMQADGEEVLQVDQTERLTPIYAISADGQRIVYCVTGGPVRLYSAVTHTSVSLDVPGGPTTTVQNADFSHDGKTLVLMTSDSALTYNLDALDAGAIDVLAPASRESRDAYENRQLKTLTLLSSVEDATVVAVRTYQSTTPTVIAAEHGRVDGALFTHDQKYLLYRVCELTNGNRTFECTLKLADLGAANPQVQTIATIPNLTLSGYNEGLLGEFTRDERHILLSITYRGDSETLLYSIESGETSKIDPTLYSATTGRGERDVYVQGADYLLDDYVPGLQSWVGSNSLGRTAQNLRRPADHFTRVVGHWITVTPNNRFVLALSLHITESSRFYRLSTAPLTWNSAEAPDAGRVLFSTKALPREWLPSTRVLSDGYTLIAAAPLNDSYIPDVRAYSLDGSGDSDVVLADAARLLDLYSFPEQK